MCSYKLAAVTSYKIHTILRRVGGWAEGGPIAHGFRAPVVEANVEKRDSTATGKVTFFVAHFKGKIKEKGKLKCKDKTGCKTEIKDVLSGVFVRCGPSCGGRFHLRALGLKKIKKGS